MREPSIESTQRARSARTDHELYQLIEREPGLSKYELKNKMNWVMGKTDGSVTRLLKSNKIFIQSIERNGRRVNLIFPIEYKLTDTVRIPKSELKIHNPFWLDTAFMYALDSNTIGVSGESSVTWDEISCFQKEIKLIHNDNDICFEVPEDFKNFYQLDHKHYVVSINANNVLITVSGNIIEGKKSDQSSR